MVKLDICVHIPLLFVHLIDVFILFGQLVSYSFLCEPVYISNEHVAQSRIASAAKCVLHTADTIAIFLNICIDICNNKNTLVLVFRALVKKKLLIKEILLNPIKDTKNNTIGV